MMRHVVSVIVENKPGVLVRIAGLFSRRGYNIDSLAVGETENPDFSRITIVVTGEDQIIEQITKKLHKLIDTYKVIDLTPTKHVAREMVLIKVHITDKSRSEAIEIVDIFRGKIVAVNEKNMTVEMTGDIEKVEGLISLLRKFGIMEICRSGTIALQRS